MCFARPKAVHLTSHCRACECFALFPDLGVGRKPLMIGKPRPREGGRVPAGYPGDTKQNDELVISHATCIKRLSVQWP